MSEDRYPGTGAPWRPPLVLLATHPHSTLPALRRLVGVRKALHTVPHAEIGLELDVTPWLTQKVSAVLTHRSEVERGALPGLVARMSASERATLLGTEWYSTVDPAVGSPGLTG